MNKEFDDKLLKITHYQNYPCYMPFIVITMGKQNFESSQKVIIYQNVVKKMIILMIGIKE